VVKNSSALIPESGELRGFGRDVGLDELCQDIVGIWAPVVFEEAGDGEPGGNLAADLIVERVSEVGGFVHVAVGGELLVGDAGEVGVRNAMTHLEFAFVFAKHGVEDAVDWVGESGEERTTWTKHAEGFVPDGLDVGDESIRAGMENQIEAGIGELAEVAHIALHRAQIQTFPIRDQAVLSELIGGVVEDRDLRSSRSQDGPLLASGTGKAEDFAVGQWREPIHRNRKVRSQDDGNVPQARLFDDFRRDRLGPAVALAHLGIPHGFVVGPDLFWSSRLFQHRGVG